ncbi:MAG: hypothetical protein ACRYE7_01885 [Janthinobacterium lividum]
MPVDTPYAFLNGYIMGLNSKEILNMKRGPDGKIYYLAEWKKTLRPTYIEAEVAKSKCPTLVCEFYEKHTVFNDDTTMRR